MYLSRLRLNPQCREVQRDLADCHEMHRTIMRAFPEVGPSARAACGVLYRVEPHRGYGPVTVLVQSRVHPDWIRLPEGYLLPGPLGCAVKDISGLLEAIRPGLWLRFRLLANATRKIRSENPNGRRVPLRKEEAAVAWLRRKAEAAGFELTELSSVQNLTDVRVLGGSAFRVEGRHPAGRITLEGVLFEGRLRVVDAERFRQALVTGIGPAKAYGFGLLSVGPA